MTVFAQTMQKVTISLPSELLAYADAQAKSLQTSRSQVISDALAERKAAEEAALAVEGYRFYAAEACEFAASSAAATAEAWHDAR